MMEITNEEIKEKIFDNIDNDEYVDPFPDISIKNTKILSNITKVSSEYYLTDENIYYIVETCFDNKFFLYNEIIYSIDMSNKINRDFQFILPLIKKYFDEVFGPRFATIYRIYQFGDDFLDQHSNCINAYGWKRISLYQKLSKKFIYKYADKLDMNLIKNYNPYCKDLFD